MLMSEAQISSTVGRTAAANDESSESSESSGESSVRLYLALVPRDTGFTPKISMLKIIRVFKTGFSVILSVTRNFCPKVAHLSRTCSLGVR